MIRILHLEDNVRDAELTRCLLESTEFACNINHVKNQAEFEAAVIGGQYDIILSDFALSHYNGLTALDFARKISPDVPFILLSGTIGEDLAVQSLKTGATDYILKQKPARLIEAVRRALEETRQRAMRRDAEQALRRSEERFQYAARATNDVIWDWNLQTNHYWCSENVYRVFGYLSNAVTSDIDFWMSRLHSEDRERVLASLKTLDEGSGSVWSSEYRFRRANGEYADVLDRGYIIHEGGKAVRMIGAMMDMTERKKMEAQFLRAQRMESIGALAGGIAHDLNNMLSPILMAVDLLRDSQGEENRQILEMVGTSAQRGADMVRQILSFARGASGEHVQTEIRHVIKDIARLAKDTFPRSIRIDSSVSPELWQVKGNVTQLHQVLLNLAVNARDAMPDGGALKILAENVTLNGAISRWKNEPATGPHIRLTVSDTGIGIPPDVMDKLFDPFFTTKEDGKGTGLGLSTVMGIVKQHCGFVDIRSEPGRGTDFLVFLPACQSSQAKESYAAVQAPNGNGEKILLVDDEEALVEMTRLTLEAHNYQVLTARNGAAAIGLYLEHRDNIHVVVTDLMMPVMDGPATIRELQKINPDVKIVTISGLGSRVNRLKVEQMNVAATLKKPYPAEALLRIIHDVLEAVPAA